MLERNFSLLFSASLSGATRTHDTASQGAETGWSRDQAGTGQCACQGQARRGFEEHQRRRILSLCFRTLEINDVISEAVKEPTYNLQGRSSRPFPTVEPSKTIPVKPRPVSKPFPTTWSVGSSVSRYDGLHRRLTGGKVPSRRGDPSTSSGIRPRTQRSRIRFRQTYPTNGTWPTSFDSTPFARNSDLCVLVAVIRHQGRFHVLKSVIDN